MIRSKLARFAIVGVMAAAIPAFAVATRHHKLTAKPAAKTTAVAVKPTAKKVTAKKVVTHKLATKNHVAHKLATRKTPAKKLSTAKKPATKLTVKKTVKSM